MLQGEKSDISGCVRNTKFNVLQEIVIEEEGERKESWGKFQGKGYDGYLLEVFRRTERKHHLVLIKKCDFGLCIFANHA